MEETTLLPRNYPKQLQNISDPPCKLYTKGNTEILHSRHAISIIGARRNTPYAQTVLENIVAPLLEQYKITVVSGLALGIDGLAHRLALKHNRPTIAILGSGWNNDVLYPSYHRTLAQKILDQNGLLLSEYSAKTGPRKHHFIARNRIIAGLSFLTLVIEASEKSGTLITAQFALDEGREVGAIPADITRTTSSGTNTLLKAGAHCITTTQDLINILDLPKEEAQKELPKNITPQEKELLQLIGEATTTLDILVKDSTLNIGEILAILTTLELKGVIYSPSHHTYSKQ